MTTCNFLNTEDLQEDMAEKALEKDEEGNYGYTIWLKNNISTLYWTTLFLKQFK